jgi:aryl-alcohol dehydrogenase-like predicted oxidoreductase
MSMQVRTLGRSGPAVSALGLGCMGMSPGIYGPSDDAESVVTLQAAVEAGITLIDTGDFLRHGPQRDADPARPGSRLTE